ncbi:NTP transferase domain-containing protein [candidate division WOR-3 bacterium]|nr:NTP transferase domain-containing protein [candidate division WOR-3 bacterium]
MTVVIPLAGYGTRLKPLTHEIPKPLLNVAGDTVLGWIFKSISSLSVSRIVLLVGYRGEQIQEWVGENYPELNVKWVFQKQMKGLGHAIWTAGKGIPLEEDVLIYLGDTIFDVDWAEIDKGAKNFIAVKEVEDPERFGIAEIKNGRVIDMVEKPDNPTSNLAVVGLYYIKRWGKLFSCLNQIIEMDMKTKGEYQLTDALRMLIGEEKLVIEPLSVKGWFDCGTKKTLLKTNAALLLNHQRNKFKKGTVKGPCYIHDSAVIRNSIIGPFVSIGENSVIENSCVDNSIIGSGVTTLNAKVHSSIIGDRVEIKNSEGVFHLASDSIVVGKEVE